MLAEQVAVSLDDRQDQHDEAPERQRMRGARYRPLEQFALPDHLGHLGLALPARVLAQRLNPLRGRLTTAPEPVQPEQAVAGERGRDDRQGQSEDDSQRQGNLQVRQWETA